MAGDEIRLTLPRDRDFYGVAHLVLGGLAVRLNLTYEELEDLELGLDGLLSRNEGDDDVTVSVWLAGEAIHTSVGPFFGDALRRELEPSGAEELGLRRVLDAVADSVEIGEYEGGQWVELVKTIHPAPHER